MIQYNYLQKRTTMNKSIILNSRSSLMVKQSEKDNEYQKRWGVVCSGVSLLLDRNTTLGRNKVQLPPLALTVNLKRR